MDAVIWEWLNLVLRWAHVVAAIMWIGDSLLFMWMDRSLEPPRQPREGDVIGEMWMTHGGGFYEVVKRRSLRPEQVPETLHWFKWESYSTWISGFFLITIVYYLGGQALLVEAGGPLSHWQGVALSISLLFAGVGFYDLLTRTPLAENPRLFALMGLPAIVLVAWALDGVFTDRAVFLQVGAMLATIMSSNVFLRIIPAQKRMMAATLAGLPVDTSQGVKGKKHSTFNHYITFPVLLLMLSNHFPSVYATKWPWASLALVAVVGVGVKIFMNQRLRMPGWQMAGTLGAMGLLGWMSLPERPAAALVDANAPQVEFAAVQQIVQMRCVSCHAAQPTNPAFPSPAGGALLETPEQMKALKERMLVRAVHTKSMPLGNLTGMLDEERATLALWIAQGADISGAKAPESPAVVETALAPSLPKDGKTLYAQRCVACHGETGRADGPLAAALDPKPKNFTDREWQDHEPDEEIRRAIVGGGLAVGDSPLMPANPDLEGQDELLDDLVRYIRSLRQ